MIRAFDEADRKSKKTANNVGKNLTKMAKTATVAFAAIGGAAVLMGRELFEAGVQMQGITRALNTAAGSAEKGAQSLNFVRRESGRLGLDLQVAAGSFAKLSAASKGTALEGAETRNIFTAVSEASRVLSLNADATAGAFRAIEQVMSKGKVQAEELRGQLGERLPGAFQLAARAMGVTTQQLDKMLELGQVTAEDLLPSLANELRKTFGPGVPDAANDAQAAVNRLNNALFELKVTIANSGVLDFITSLATKLAQALPHIQAMASEFFNLEKQIEGMTFDRLTAEADLLSEKAIDLHTWLSREHPSSPTFKALQDELKRTQDEYDAVIAQQERLSAATPSTAAIDSGPVESVAESALGNDAYKAQLDERTRLALEAARARAEGELVIQRELDAMKLQGQAVTDAQLMEMAAAQAAGIVQAEYAARAEALAENGEPPTQAERDALKLEMQKLHGEETIRIAKEIAKKRVAIEAEQAKALQTYDARTLNGKINIAKATLGLAAAFGKKSNKLQKAAMLANKAIAIKDSIIAITGGVAKALNNPYPANLAFAATVAAQGVGLMATLSSIGGGGGGFSGGSSVGGSTAAIPEEENPNDRESTTAVTVIIQGNVIGEDEYVDSKIIPAIQAAVKDRDVVLIDSESRNAQDIVSQNTTVA